MSIAALVLAGCGAEQSPPAPTPTAAPGEAVSFAEAPCPSPNVPGEPEADLGPEFSCGYLTVPENRNDPDGRKIKIAVARVKAASPSPKPDPLVYLSGGPGDTALASAVHIVKFGFNQDRDVIFVDQRGTMHSDPFLSCPETDSFTVEAAGMSIQSEETRERDLSAIKACRDRLAGAGYDLSAYNTAENAADIADLRVALGIDQWNLYGVSYGSNLAQQLLRDHPEGIRSAVIHSVVPPQSNLADIFWPSAAEGYAALFDACAAQPACAAAYPKLRDEFTTAVNRLAQQPLSVELPGDDGRPPQTVVIDGYTLANLVVLLSIPPGTPDGIPAMIHDIWSGDGTAVAKALVGTLPPPGPIVHSMGWGLTYGVFCREYAASTDREAALTPANQALPAFPDNVLSLLPQLPRLFDECEIWEAGRADPSVHEPPRSDVPVLIMNGTLDAITPPSEAEKAARALPRSQLVLVPGFGHGALPLSACVNSIMLDFLNRADTVNTGCIASIRMPTFTT